MWILFLCVCFFPLFRSHVSYLFFLLNTSEMVKYNTLLGLMFLRRSVAHYKLLIFMDKVYSTATLSPAPFHSSRLPQLLGQSIQTYCMETIFCTTIYIGCNAVCVGVCVRARVFVPETKLLYNLWTWLAFCLRPNKAHSEHQKLIRRFTFSHLSRAGQCSCELTHTHAQIPAKCPFIRIM